MPVHHANINGNATQLENKVDAPYNAQDPTPALNPLDLSTMDFGTYTPAGNNEHLGSQTSAFYVFYYAVKGGDDFVLYQLAAPTLTFNWLTGDLRNNGGQEPGLSHVMWFGDADYTPPSLAPEPAAWAMMLMGFFGVGGAVRTRRRTAAHA